MPKQHFAIEEVKDERNIDIPIMVSGTITMLQEEHFLGKQ
jgi:methionine synthase I (cobalamin-dependent)